MLLSPTARAALNAAMAALPDTGTGDAVLVLRTGSAPAATTDADTGTLLATFTLPDPAFPSPSGGNASAASIPDATGAAAGTIGHYRVKNGSGTVIWQGNSVGVTGSGAEVEVSTLTVSSGLILDLVSWTLVQPAGAN